MAKVTYYIVRDAKGEVQMRRSDRETKLQLSDSVLLTTTTGLAANKAYYALGGK